MNPVAIGLDLLLAVLLMAALVLGARLNARLKALRDSQAGFAAAVLELNQAAARAEAGLASLAAATDAAHDSLLDRIETARALAKRLDQVNVRAETAFLEDTRQAPTAPSSAPPAAPNASPFGDKPLTRGPLAELAASLKARVGQSPTHEQAQRQPATARPIASVRPRSSMDDDLFEGDDAARRKPRLPDFPRRQRDDTR